MIDTLLLKGELLVEGVGVTDEALRGVGTDFKEQNHGLFGWDLEDHGNQQLPDDFRLFDGTVVQLRKRGASPFLIDAVGEGILSLIKNGEPICEVSWISRPTYYEKTTSDGVPMLKIGQIGGADCFFVCYNNYCSHFAKGNECLFCNLVDTTKKYHTVITRKVARQVGETANAAFEEGVAKHILLTGGCFGNERETDVVCSILKSVKKATGFDRVPGVLLPSPPGNMDDLKRYFDEGITALAFSLEIWDKEFYRAFCPGKSEATPREKFIEVIRESAKIFGAGNVYAVFVMGLEPRDSLMEGIDLLSDLGAHIVPFVWSPNPGSRLYGHRAPFGEWYAENVRRYAEIIASKELPPSIYHCRECDGNNMLHDALYELHRATKETGTSKNYRWE